MKRAGFINYRGFTHSLTSYTIGESRLNKYICIDALCVCIIRCTICRYIIKVSPKKKREIRLDQAFEDYLKRKYDGITWVMSFYSFPYIHAHMGTHAYTQDLLEDLSMRFRFKHTQIVYVACLYLPWHR